MKQKERQAIAEEFIRKIWIAAFSKCLTIVAEKLQHDDVFFSPTVEKEEIERAFQEWNDENN